MVIFFGAVLIILIVRMAKYGQFSIVLPDKNAVIAINAESRDADAMMECCMDIIVPQL